MVHIKNLILWVIVFTFIITTFPASSFTNNQKGNFYIEAGHNLRKHVVALQAGKKLIKEGPGFSMPVIRVNEELADEELVIN